MRIVCRRILLLMVALIVPAVASAQNHYPLEMRAPRATLPAGHRMTRAYPNLLYEVRAHVVGGHYPYRFRLLNAPEGMTVVDGPCATIGLECRAGTIAWPNPQGPGSVSPTIETCDVANRCVRETWTITVSRQDFLFIDAVNGNDAWNGTEPRFTSGANGPKRTLASTKAADNGRTIWYFMTGPYSLAGLALEGGNPLVEFDFEGDAGTGNSTMWIAYPGESPVFDIRYPSITQAPFARFVSPFFYIDGFTCTNDWIKCWEWAAVSGNSHATVRNSRFLNGGPGQDGLNAGFIMTASNSYQFQGSMALQNNVFGVAGHNALKLYSLSKALIEDNDLPRGNEGIAVKAAVSQFTIRSNRFLGCNLGCVTGNWNISNGLGTFGEVYHNFSMGSGMGFIYAAESLVGHPIGPLWTYRNTIVDTIRIDRVSAADNLLTFTGNVIINLTPQSGSCPAKFTFISSDCSRVVATNNLLAGAPDGIVDAQGRLLGTWRTEFLGMRGYELGDSTAPPQPVDCVVSAFTLQSSGPWSACINSQQTRTETWARTILTPPSNGGVACPALTEQRTGTQACSVTPPQPPPSCDDSGTAYPPGTKRKVNVADSQFSARVAALEGAGWQLQYPGASSSQTFVIATCRPQ